MKDPGSPHFTIPVMWKFAKLVIKLTRMESVTFLEATRYKRQALANPPSHSRCTSESSSSNP